jgi:hypothetical protein
MAMDHLGYIWRNMQLEEPDSKLVAKSSAKRTKWSVTRRIGVS